MSHWLRSKMSNLICSAQKMREAILNVVPEWEGHIQVSSEGNLTLQSGFEASRGGYHIKVPISAPGVRYADLGLKQMEDGTWQIEYDSMGLPSSFRNPTKVLKDEINAMRARELAAINGIELTEDSKQGNKRTQKMRVTAQDVEKLVQSLSS